jgi:hypothetical protein
MARVSITGDADPFRNLKFCKSTIYIFNIKINFVLEPSYIKIYFVPQSYL